MIKYLIMLILTFGSLHGVDIKGDFAPPKKSGAPPSGWALTSGSKGTMEVVSTEIGNFVMLNAAPESNIGIYSNKILARKDSKITIRAKLFGSKITFAIFQYGNRKVTAQRQELKITEDGCVLSHTFTVTAPEETPVEHIRVAFQVHNGNAAAVGKAEAALEP